MFESLYVQSDELGLFLCSCSIFRIFSSDGTKIYNKLTHESVKDI